MSVLTLVRHAQASFFADNYDELSPLGRKQARLLGEFWVRRQIDFDEVYCGPRVRQQTNRGNRRLRLHSSGKNLAGAGGARGIRRVRPAAIFSATSLRICRDRMPPSRSCWRTIAATRTAPTARAASRRCSKR